MNRAVSSRAASSGHARSLAEIERAIRERTMAPKPRSLLDEFEIAFPGDPQVDRLARVPRVRATGVRSQERLGRARSGAASVNDPDRVLELYHAVALDSTTRGSRSLESEVAQWFLTLIYRRLRTGKIQVEVVELAGRFAETFADDRRGRQRACRSAHPPAQRGLCPRCAQPYIGIAQACPECLRAARGAQPRRPAAIELGSTR